MAVIIQARVFQKKDTLANWMTNELVLGTGEIAFVVSDDGETDIGYKIGVGDKIFSEIPWPLYVVVSKNVSTYASMLLDTTPIIPTEYRVLLDENKGISNSIYKWYPDGKRIWIAATDDN